MLHELLFALNGYPGDIFILNDEKQLVVDSALPFISKAEKNVIDEILVLGSHYMQIQEFVSGQLLQNPGKYVTALCESVDAQLCGYRQCLLDVESALLEDTGLGIASVCQSVRPHSSLIRALLRLTADVTRLEARGCRLLDVLHRHAAEAVADQRAPLLALQTSCLRVLYAQLSGWLLYGLLTDAQDELFIRRRRADTDRTGCEEPDSGIGVHAKLHRLCDEEAERRSRDAIQYELLPDMLPSCLPLSLCEDVLFVGNTIGLCRCRGVDGPVLHVLDGHERQLAEQLEQLAAAPSFSLLKLLRLVGRFKSLVSGHLWRLVVEETELHRHLSVVRAFLLAGRGAVFQELHAECDRQLSASVSSTAAAALQLDVNAAFLVVCGRLGIDDDAVLDNVYFTLAADSKQPVSTGWDRLQVHYSVPWPLHLLFTPAVFSAYNRVFSFLLLVKRTQLMLHQCWVSNLRQQHSQGVMWFCHIQALVFLVTNLQHYLLVDVIEPEYARLLSVVETRRDFVQLQLAHDTFVNRVTDQCFLNATRVSQYLRELLVTCQQLSVASSLSSASAQRDDPVLLHRTVVTKAQVLFRVLSGMSDQRTGSHLTRLLHRLDFNYYFSNTLRVQGD